MNYIKHMKDIISQNDTSAMINLIDQYKTQQESLNDNKVEIKFVLSTLISLGRLEELKYLLTTLDVPLEHISDDIESLVVKKPDNHLEILNYLLKNEKVQKRFSSHTQLKQMTKHFTVDEIYIVLESVEDKPEKLGLFIRTIITQMSKVEDLLFIKGDEKVHLIKNVAKKYPAFLKSKIYKEVFENSFNSNATQLAQYLLDQKIISQEYLYDIFYLNFNSNFKIHENNITLLISHNFPLLDNRYTFFKSYIAKSSNEKLRHEYGAYIFNEYPDNLEKLLNCAKNELQEKQTLSHGKYNNIYENECNRLIITIKEYEKYVSAYNLSNNLVAKTHTVKNKI